MGKLTLKDAITVRPASLLNAADIAHIHLNCWKNNYKGIIDQSFLDTLTLEDRLKNRQKILKESTDIHFIALYQNKIVGFCDAGHFYFRTNQKLSTEQRNNRNEPGEIYSMYVSPEYQNRGIGKFLFEQARNELNNKGLIPFIIWTLKDNQASCQFYESLGGIRIDEMVRSFGGREYSQVAYRLEQ